MALFNRTLKKPNTVTPLVLSPFGILTTPTIGKGESIVCCLKPGDHCFNEILTPRL